YFSQKVVAREFFLNDTSRSTAKALREERGLFGNVQIIGWKPITVEITKDRSVYCRGEYVAVPLFLLPGLNTIPFEVFMSKNRLRGFPPKVGAEAPRAELDSVLAFYQLDVDGVSSPLDFQTRVFHTADKEALCSKCHAAEAGQVSTSGVPLKCESCHGIMASQKAVHALVATNDCSTCHNSEPGSGYAATYSVDNETETCFTCHDDIGNNIKSKAVVHVPAAGGQCSLCHSPHASANPFLLRKQVNTLCITCHDEKKEENHPVVFHPVGDRPDPRQPGKPLSCVSCHDPHASDNNSLLLARGGYFGLCQSCHKK
ncbi:MAG: cytochrome c3 family protein, partial [Bacteroidota bacterium]